MRCREVREAVLSARTESVATVHDHLKSCDECRTLAELSSAASVGPGASEAELDFLWRRVENAVAHEKGWAAWLRSVPTRWRVIFAATAATGIAVTVLVTTPRGDLHAYPGARLLLSLGIFAVALIALITLELRPLQRPALSSRASVLALLALALPLSVALLPEAALNHPVVAHQQYDCGLVGLTCGGALIALLRALDRSDAASVVIPAAAGGILANAALVFHCPAVSQLHLALAHAPIGLVLLFGYKGLRSARLRIARARGA